MAPLDCTVAAKILILVQTFRYFVLKSDGQLLGYKNKPVNNSDPCNNFTVRGCQTMTSESPKPYGFALRGLYMETVVERIFHTETESTEPSARGFSNVSVGVRVHWSSDWAVRTSYDHYTLFRSQAIIAVVISVATMVLSKSYTLKVWRNGFLKFGVGIFHWVFYWIKV